MNKYSDAVPTNDNLVSVSNDFETQEASKNILDRLEKLKLVSEELRDISNQQIMYAIFLSGHRRPRTASVVHEIAAGQ